MQDKSESTQIPAERWWDITRAAGAYALLGGLLALAGWAGVYDRLKDWDGSGITMKVNAALAAIAAGSALVMLRHPRASRWVCLLGVFCTGLGVLTLFQHLTGFSLGIDTLIFNEPANVRATASPNRMGPPASSCFALIGIALVLRSRGTAHARVAIGMAIAVLTISLLSLTGYLYGAEEMYSISKVSGIAMQTATMVAALAVGLLASYPDHDPVRSLNEQSAAGVLTRRLLPFVLIVPLAIGWLRLQGQAAGLYDNQFGAALRTIVETGLFAGMLYWCVRAIRKHEQARASAMLMLGESEQRLALTLESITDGLITLDAQWRFSYVNSEAEKLLGKPRQELLGKNAWELFPEMISTAVERDLRRVALERVTLEVEGLNPRMGRVFLNRVYPGFQEGVAVYFHDITARKQAEETLREANQRKDEFIAILAHELRNPLAPIRNAARLISLPTSTQQHLRWGSELIERQVKHMSRLLDDLLDVSRISRNKLDLRREWSEVRVVIDAALETSKPLLEAGDHEFLAILPNEPLYINADAVRIAQLISNLLNNAAKYTPAGGHIELRVELVKSMVVITVSDDGIGISPDKLEKIFDMFWQDPDAQVHAQGGLGIGLSLAKGLAELHGGSIEAQSGGPGKGSQFILRLPAVFESPNVDASRVNSVVAPAQSRRILVVDDIKDNADSLAGLLEGMGHKTITAYDGVAALRAAFQERPDIVLLDIGMPGMDGLEVCRRLRAETWGRSMYIAALTGWGQQTDQDRSADAGCDSHLTKPVDIERLVDLLRSSSRK